ncbi:hypothetical protein [Hydrogenophaga sp. 5NK40-0174]|uniref:hypothetical protein n=1 Tax=Hydrogenophaga sp. 5NK40-0174 TaxID=3127649 RepID=UPI00310C64E2
MTVGLASSARASHALVLTAVTATLTLGGCAAYKVEAVGPQASAPVKSSAPAGKPGKALKTGVAPALKVVPDRASHIEGRGFQCHEPLLYVLSLGLIPAVCVKGYELRSNEEVLGRYEVSMMMGWAAMFAAMSPGWSLGSGDERAETQIRRQSGALRSGAR